MKKILLTMFIMMSVLQANASSNKGIYVVKNSNIEQITKDLTGKLNSITKVDSKNNVIYSLEENYYIKLYSVDNKTELFLFSKDKNKEISGVINSLNYKVFLMQDDATEKRYEKDLVDYSKEYNLNFVKTNNKKTNSKYKNYNPYSKTIKNKIIGTSEISNNGIDIKRIQYQPKYKVKKKANEYEYIITNNTKNDIVINKVASAEFLGLTQIAAYCMIPQAMDFVPIYGIVYGAQTDIEKK